MQRNQVGEFEELTLLAVRGVNEPAYAVPIQRYLEKKAGRAVSMGAVYAALGRLEDKGLVRSDLGESSERRGGKRPRLYEVTREGMRAIQERRRVRERLWRAIEESRS